MHSIEFNIKVRKIRLKIDLFLPFLINRLIQIYTWSKQNKNLTIVYNTVFQFI